MFDDATTLHLFGRQHGVASTSQLRQLGVTPKVLTGARRRGVVVPVVQQVVRLAGMADSFESRAMALVLRAGPDGCLADVTAGELWGLRRLPASKVTIMIPERRRMEVPDWARLMRTSWLDADRVVRADGLCVSSPLRTLFTLGSRFGSERFEHAAEDMWHKGLITPGEARDYLAQVRRQGRSGVKRFERWLEDVGARCAPSQSGLEVDLAQAVVRMGLPAPRRQLALRLATGAEIHLDLAWDDVRLGLEPGHSWWHGGNDQMRADAERDRLCDEIGWRILRYDEKELRDLVRCARQIAAIYRSRKAQIFGGSVSLQGHRTRSEVG